jgi:hypothetical protein
MSSAVYGYVSVTFSSLEKNQAAALGGQLPDKKKKFMIGAGGFEPPTSTVLRRLKGDLPFSG